jgi:hypothetical protein
MGQSLKIFNFLFVPLPFHFYMKCVVGSSHLVQVLTSHPQHCSQALHLILPAAGSQVHRHIYTGDSHTLPKILNTEHKETHLSSLPLDIQYTYTVHMLG